MKYIPDHVFPRAARGMLAWLCGAYTVCTGTVNYIILEPTVDKERALAYQRILAQPDAFGVVMIVVGLACVFCSYCQKGRDRFGLTVLAIWTFLWAGGFVWSMIFFHAGVPALPPLFAWSLVCSISLVGLVKLAGSDVVR